MYVFFLFASNLLFINTQGNNETETSIVTSDPNAERMAEIMKYKNICVPTPIGIDYLSSFQEDCSKLAKYPTNESEFYCCRLEFQEKKNSSAPVRKGCIAILTNYVDKDRYEDIIDYIEMGKQEKIEQYSIFLGKTASEQFAGFVKNRTKYKVNTFDCSYKYIMMKSIMMFLLSILLY